MVVVVWIHVTNDMRIHCGYVNGIGSVEFLQCDKVKPENVSDKLSRALENKKTFLKSIIVKNSGHFVAEEVPEQFNFAVINFLTLNSNKRLNEKR